MVHINLVKTFEGYSFMNDFNNINGYNSIYLMNDLPKFKPVHNPYRICFILNLVSILAAGIPWIFGVLYVLFWVVLGVCTFFIIWVELDFDFFKVVAKFSFIEIIFVIISLTLNIISLKRYKDIPDNILMLITSIFVLVFDIVGGIVLIYIRKMICNHFGNVILIVFFIFLVGAISCAVLSIVENNIIKKSRM